MKFTVFLLFICLAVSSVKGMDANGNLKGTSSITWNFSFSEPKVILHVKTNESKLTLNYPQVEKSAAIVENEKHKIVKNSIAVLLQI